MPRKFMTLCAQHHARRLKSNNGRGPVDRRIRAFLCGKTHGEDVLLALYGNVADEPVPERLRAILKR